MITITSICHSLRLSALLLILVGGNALAQETLTEIEQLRKSAEAGESAAQFDLGNRYLYGDGVVADDFEAARWFREAAEQDNNNAQYNLGVMTMQGKGVITDLPQAIEWFLKAANQGDAPAQFTMATLYANGRGVPQDPLQAHMWFTLAASSGHRAAAANVVLYQEMLSDRQIIEAQRLAAAWIENFNKQLADDDNTAAVNAGAQ
jgi:TPR repeat protein